MSISSGFGLRSFTEHAAAHLVDSGVIVNLASLAAFQWRANLDVVKAAAAMSFGTLMHGLPEQPVEGAAFA